MTIIMRKGAISPRIILVPIVPDPFFGRSAAFLRKQSGTQLRALSSTTLYLWVKIWRDRLSPPWVGYRKSDRLVCLNMLKNSSLSKTVVPWSSWSSERPMKVPLSRPPLELSYCFCRGSCVVSTKCKHPTLTRSSDDQDDHGTTVFIGYRF